MPVVAPRHTKCAAKSCDHHLFATVKPIQQEGCPQRISLGDHTDNEIFQSSRICIDTNTKAGRRQWCLRSTFLQYVSGLSSGSIFTACRKSLLAAAAGGRLHRPSHRLCPLPVLASYKPTQQKTASVCCLRTSSASICPHPTAPQKASA